MISWRFKDGFFGDSFFYPCTSIVEFGGGKSERVLVIVRDIVGNSPLERGPKRMVEAIIGDNEN